MSDEFILDAKTSELVIEQVLLLPDGRTTMDKDGWKAIWAYVACDDIARGHLEGITVDEFQESEDEEYVDNIIDKVYRKHTHLYYH